MVWWGAKGEEGGGGVSGSCIVLGAFFAVGQGLFQGGLGGVRFEVARRYG